MALRLAAFLPARESVLEDLGDLAPEARLDHIATRSTGTTVFISHKTADYTDAQHPAQQLSSLGLSVYFVEDDPNVPPGDRDTLPDEIKAVVRKSKGLLVYASDTLVSEDSSWVCFEVGLAEMTDVHTARYTITQHDSDLLSPLRRLQSVVDSDLPAWATMVSAS